MIQATGWVVIRQPFDRVHKRLGDRPNPARWRWALFLTVAVLVMVPPAAQSKAPGMPDAASQEPGNPPKSDSARATLPPRALLRIGTTDLRMQDYIITIPFSPDGRLVAAVAASAINAPSPSASIFVVRTGRRVKQLFLPGNNFFWAESLAFSPDGTKLLCGEPSGEVALWKLAGSRLLFRQRLHTSSVTAVGFSSDGQVLASGLASTGSSDCGGSTGLKRPCGT